MMDMKISQGSASPLRGEPAPTIHSEYKVVMHVNPTSELSTNLDKARTAISAALSGVTSPEQDNISFALRKAIDAHSTAHLAIMKNTEPKLLVVLEHLPVIENDPLCRHITADTKRQFLEALKRVPGLPVSYYATMQSTDSLSAKELTDQMISIIDWMNKEYKGVYAKAADLYIAFFKEFSNFIAQRGQYIKANESDPAKMVVQFDKIAQLLIDIRIEFASKPMVGPLNSEKDAKEWAKNLGMPPECVKQSASGEWYVYMDMGPIDEILKTCLDKNGTASVEYVDWNEDQGWLLTSGTAFEAITRTTELMGSSPPLSEDDYIACQGQLNNILKQSARPNDIGTVEHDIWKSGSSSQEETIRNTVQTIAEMYSHAVTETDNMVKIMSNMINSLHEALMKIINNFHS